MAEKREQLWCLELAAHIVRGEVSHESVDCDGLASDLDALRAKLMRPAEPVRGEDAYLVSDLHEAIYNVRENPAVRPEDLVGTLERCRIALTREPPSSSGTPKRCPEIGPDGYQRCGDYDGHVGSHTLLIPSDAPWFPERCPDGGGEPVPYSPADTLQRYATPDSQGGVSGTQEWKQERPSWCPHTDCAFRRRAMDAICGGELPKPEDHDGTPNTHRVCWNGAGRAGEVLDLQVNGTDLGWFRWIFDAMDGLATSWLSRPTHTDLMISPGEIDAIPDAAWDASVEQIHRELAGEVVPPESAPEPELVDIYMALDWRPAFWRQVEYAWLPEDEVFLTRWIAARTCGLKGEGGDVASAVSDLMDATALYLRVNSVPPVAQEREPEHARLRDPRDHYFLRPSGIYCAICGMDAEAHLGASEPTGEEKP
jgi:hypothetical protein